MKPSGFIKKLKRNNIMKIELNINEISLDEQCTPNQYSGFKVVSSQMANLWTSDANFGLMFEDRILYEARLDPLIVAAVFEIPSNSRETIDLRIQMFEFPLTTVEALTFVALAAFSYENPNEDRASLLKEWRQVSLNRKMGRGFQLLSQVMGHAADDPESHYNKLYNEYHKVISNRQRIHEEFSKMLGDN